MSDTKEPWAYLQGVRVTADGIYKGLVGEVQEDRGEDGDDDAGVLVKFFQPVGHAHRVDPEPVLLWHDELEEVDDWTLYDAQVDQWSPEKLLETLKIEARLRGKYQEVAEFYANPETYFAILMLGDPPCGALLDDLSEVPPPMGGERPGRRARVALGWEKE